MNLTLRTRSRARRRVALIAAAVLTASMAAACGSGTPSNAAPADLRLSLIVGLRRDDAGLAADALNRSSPSAAEYLKWLSPAEMTERFGASPEHVQGALGVLQKAGFEGGVDPTGGLLVGTMRAGDAAELFGTAIVQLPFGTSGVLAMPAKPLTVPKKLAAYATEVIGLVGAIDHDTTTTVPAPADPPPADPPCPTVKGLGPKLRAHYRLQPLIDAGSTGKGVRMAMLEVSPTSQKAVQLFGACRPFKIPPVTVTAADPSTPEAFPSMAIESTLDLIAAALVSPGLDGIDIYQVNPFAPVAVGLAAILNTANGPNGLPALISLSLGFCEPQVTDAEIAVSERVLAGLSAMGTSVLASTGDFGSSACAPDDLAESVQYPASSPWVTGVGGTSLVETNGQITDEVAWLVNGNAGGGGRTSRIPRPAFQVDVPIPGNRIVPDVAFVANPANLGPIPTCDSDNRCTWQINGGTSATAPGAAGGTALILQYLASTDGIPRRLGALNPGLYGVARNRSAAGDSSGGYRDIVSGSNDVHKIGCCSTAPGYDAVTGLGVMDFWDLAQRLKAVIARPR
jgi:kumamolisin